MGFPFNEQLPNIARTNQAYSFTIANTTYKSNSQGEITYQATNLPAWLTFDSGSRTFLGTPQEVDVGEFTITLTGTDESDQSQMTNDYTMLVSNDPGIEISSPNVMFNEIASMGRTDGNNGLVVKPGDVLNLKFTKDVFTLKSGSNLPIIAYYGRSADRSSLPPWISFDGETLEFSGTVPNVTSENAPSFEYGFSFIASDYYGYAGASADFKIIVGGHQLNTDLNDTIKLNGSFAQYINQQVPILTDVYLDGMEIVKENISSVYSDGLPDYLKFDSDNYTISGTLPNDPTTSAFEVIVKDIYGNTVDLQYSINVIGSVFTTDSLPDVNATKGEWFQYQILNSLFTNIADTNVSIDYDNSSWLQYHDSNMTLSGKTPNDFTQLKVSISAEMGSDSESRSFNIKGVERNVVSSTSASASTSTSSLTPTSSSASSSATTTNPTTTTSTTTTTTAAAAASKSNKDLAIGLGVGIPLGAILIAGIIIFFCCCFKKRKDSKQHDKENNLGVVIRTETPPSPQQMVPLSGKTMDSKMASQINLMKLDGLASGNSSSSSLTHVDTDDYAFHDAREQPMKSWRANTESDNKTSSPTFGTSTKPNLRNSDASMSTVNTEQLFSVRLVDDPSARNSSSSQFVSNSSINALLKRDSSSNIQKMDSNGNIVEYNTFAPNTSSEKQRQQVLSSQLHMVPEEEHSRSITAREDTSGTISNLLQKVNKSPSSTYSASIINSSSSLSSLSPPYGSTQMPNLDTSTYSYEFKTTDVESPQSDNFLLGGENNSTPATSGNYSYSKTRGKNENVTIALNTVLMNHPNISTLSWNSTHSEKLVYDSRIKNQNSKQDQLNVSKTHNGGTGTSGVPEVSLVEFTRKGSLRDSAYEPDYYHKEQSATIHNSDSD
ncbi:AXL2 [Candida oxycetoniae]|uniref:AXL2 n=1 Tax=Candida oxycetoniae TaxID=497107 RepID=A0AAI9SZ65_9ASCO|nr:AXL2 [Candida oxycetoniae]KAI3405495.2 AXL2 [Candida oxycetoniae]